MIEPIVLEEYKDRQHLQKITTSNFASNDPWKYRPDFILKVDGISMIKHHENYAADFDCIRYAFTEILGIELSKKDVNQLLFNPIEYLVKMGFTPKKEPGHLDLVCYMSPSTILADYASDHWGIVYEDKVISKWSSGPVFAHELAQIPTWFGSHVLFYKTELKAKDSIKLFM